MVVVDLLRPSIPPGTLAEYRRDVQDNMGMMESMPSLDYWFTAEFLDELLKDTAGKADVIVLMNGLPQSANSMALWNAKPAPKVAVFGGMVTGLGDRIRSGDIVAIVAHNPMAIPGDAPPPGDQQKAFDKRFVLITPKNVDEVSAKHTGFFLDGM